MDSPDPTTRPAPGTAAAQSDVHASNAPFADSYWQSSLELRHGVEVNVVGVRTIAGEVLKEFLRMHEAWRQADRLAASGLASRRSRLASLAGTAALDIAFEADGSVTIPGELLSADG